MNRISTILVAVKNPSARADPTVAKATHLARALGSSLELFHALDTLYVDLGRSGADTLRLQEVRTSRVRAQLERLAERARVAGVEVSTSISWDYPLYESIIRRARTIGAGMIVARTHAGRHYLPWVLHRTDWELLRLSPVPVLLVKTAAPYERPVLLAALDPAHRASRTTRLDAEILSITRTLGTAVRGTVHAMHAYMPIPTGIPSDTWAAPGAVDELQDQLKENARAILDEALGRNVIPRSRRHVVGCPAGLAIPDTARATNAAIVVMGSVSRSGLKAALLGNTAERALDNIPCDILVVKPRLFVDRVPAAVRGPRLAAMTPAS